MRLLLMLALLLAPAVQARPHPIHFVKRHWVVIATSGVFLAASMADTKTTIDGMRRCPSCVETSDLYGSHPSPARLWGESMAFNAGYIWIDWFGTKNSGLTGTHDFTPAERAAHPKLYRMVWLEKPASVVFMGYAAEAHARAAWHNAQIPTRSNP